MFKYTGILVTSIFLKSLEISISSDGMVNEILSTPLFKAFSAFSFARTALPA